MSLVALAIGSTMVVTADDARSQPTRPGAPGSPTFVPTPTQPQLSTCIQFTQQNFAKLEAAATATSPTSVTVSLIGFPGDYDVKSNTGFQQTVKLAPPAPSKLGALGSGGATLDRGAARGPATVAKPTPTAPATVSGSVTHSPVTPNTSNTYTITSTLPDGRKACAQVTAKTPFVPPPAVVINKDLRRSPLPPAPLVGWADLHTHPMSNLAFGGQVFWGGQDETAFQTIDTACRVNMPATGMLSALGPENSCNNFIRKNIVWAMQQNAGGVGGDTTTGAPLFANWPLWNDGTHQKMWYEWIDRARKYGGLRVMVGLSHNHEAIANAAQSFGPVRDKESSDLQIMEMKSFVARHPDIMQLARTPADLYAIASSKRVAVVLGVELDNLGNGQWNVPGKTPEQAVAAEIQRLYDQDVRYVFPIHLADNQFGGAAIYNAIFTVANVLKNGIGVGAECAPCADQIGYALPSFGQCPQCPAVAALPAFRAGHRNKSGLTPLGEVAIKEMMKRGMIVDIDHMSELAAQRALDLAMAVLPGHYPLMSGHTGPRRGDRAHYSAENSRSTAQMDKILMIGGMVGLGTEGADGWEWGKDYLQIAQRMTKPGSVAIGTDMNSFVKSPKPTGRNVRYTAAGSSAKPPGPLDIAFPKPISTEKGGPSRTWDIAVDGVAQYGMMADFVRDVGQATPQNGGFDGASLVNDKLMKSADYFWHMWEKCEASKGNVK